MSQHFDEIAKEITIAAIEKDLFTKRKSMTETSPEKLNEFNAEQIGLFYKTIAKHVNDAMQGKFESTE